MVLSQVLVESRVLVVDDEPHNVTLLVKLLERSGYLHVAGTSDPTEVMGKVTRHEPDLVLLDLNMPDISGFELLMDIQKLDRQPPIPVLVLTGDTSTDARRAALQQGARDFVTKPFDPPEVLARIRNLLEARALEKQLLEHNLRLEEAVRERTRELRESQQEVLRRLARAAEYRDDQTGTHIARVSQYAGLLAQAAGLSREECELIVEAAPLHDIGKIAIPDRILLKPGKLEPEEFEIMKTHASVGAALLEGGRSEFIRTAERIAAGHHERWDGRGYPFGKQGPDIPLPARIVSICDVFDALTSERPYKAAWPWEKAVEEISKGAGTQFDARLVGLFMSIVPEVLRVKAELQGEETPVVLSS